MTTINKVICLKVTPLSHESKEKLDKCYKKHFNVYSKLFNEIVCWGNDSVFSKDSVTKNTDGSFNFIPKDVSAQRKQIYELTDKSISYDKFSKLLNLMSVAFVDAKMARGLVSNIIGNAQSPDVVEPTDWAVIDSLLQKFDRDVVKNTKIITKIGNTLKSIGFRNREPYTTDLSPGERYSVIGNIHRAYTSWVECDKERTETYKAEELEIEKSFSALDTSVTTSLRTVLTECLEKKYINHFDPRVHAYLRDCVIPALKDKKEITDHFYLAKNEKITFSLHQGFIDLIKNTPILWKDEKPVILETIHILEKMMTHEKHHPHAFYPFVNDTNINRAQYLLGDNYTQYDFEGIGADVPTVSVVIEKRNEKTTYEFIKGKKIDFLSLMFTRSKEDKEKISLNVHTKDKYHSGDFKPSVYFEDLSVWTINDTKCTYLFQFKRKGKFVQATVKEPSIIYENGEYFVRFNMEVIQPNDTKTIDDLSWYLSTALPVSANDRSAIKESPANTERLKNISNKTFRFLGVDLGQSTPYSWAVGESTITGPVNALNIIKTGEFDNGTNDEYFNFANDIKNISKLIGITKQLSKGVSIQKLDARIINTIKNAQIFLNQSSNTVQSDKKKEAIDKFVIVVDYLDTLKKSVIAHNNDLMSLKQDFSFIGNMVLRYAKRKFGEIKLKRKFHLRDNDVSSKIHQEFKWINIIDGMKRIIRTFSYMGTDNTRTPVTLDDLNDYQTGCKDNFLKHVASSIVDVAVENNCQIIVLEDLKNKGASLNKRNDNFLQSMWSPQRIKDAIENAANWYGIKVVEVSESQTSQVHYESGTFGHREGKSLYYTNDTGKIESVNADTNAAKNIIQKFVTRHGSSRQVAVKYLSENQDEGKRIKGFLTHKFGTVAKAVEFFKKKLPQADFVYLDGDTWLSMEQKNKKQEDIKNIVFPPQKKLIKQSS